MKTLIGILVAILLSGNIAAQEEDKLQLTLSTKIWSQYVLNSGVVFHEGPVVQTDAFLTLPKGFYLDFWWSAGLNDARPSSNFGDEIDYTAGWSGEIGKKLVLDIGVAYFDLWPLFETGGDGNVVKPYAKLSRTFEVGKKHELTPLLAIEYHHPLKDMPSGAYTWTGLKDVWTVTKLLSLSQEAGVLYDSGAYDSQKTFVGYGAWEANWQVTKQFSIQLPSIRLAVPVNDSDRKTEFTYAAGGTIKF